MPLWLKGVGGCVCLCMVTLPYSHGFLSIGSATQQMASTLFLDLNDVDFNNILFDATAIEAVNPQRGHMRQLDAVVHYEAERELVVGYKDVRDDEFWVDGHIPGRPLFPGVLMIEAAAQMAAFMMKTWRIKTDGFLGFVGCDHVKFRGQVVPGDRFILLGRETKFGKRRFVAAIQGVVNDKLVFEATVSGMPI